MNSLLANPETAALIQGLKPHLGKQGAALADGMLAVINLATSNVGKDILRIIAQMSSTANKKGTSFTVQTADGPVNISIPFIMFLIFVLLIVSENQ